MEYVIADKKKAIAAGFSASTHNTTGDSMTLTAKELMFTDRLAGTLAERLNAVGGEISAPYSSSSTK